MSHLSMAVFSKSENEVMALLAPFCSSGRSNYFESNDIIDEFSIPDKSTFIDGYVICDCHLAREPSLDVQAFITAEGFLVLKDVIMWESFDSIKAARLYSSVLNRYLSRAKRENMYISLVDCHI